MPKLIELTEEDIADFWTWVKKSGPNACWSWLGAHDKDGYPIYHPHIGNKSWYRAHRVMCFLTHGDAGYMTCHTCIGNPGCINPKHLYPGTGGSNSRDRDKANKTQRGEKHYRAKLTNEQILIIAAMYRDGAPLYQISRKLGLDQRLVNRVCTGEVAKWLTGLPRGPVRKQPHYKNWL
jgi:hypothetical protein